MVEEVCHVCGDPFMLQYETSVKQRNHKRNPKCDWCRNGKVKARRVENVRQHMMWWLLTVGGMREREAWDVLAGKLPVPLEIVEMASELDAFVPVSRREGMN